MRTHAHNLPNGVSRDLTWKPFDENDSGRLDLFLLWWLCAENGQRLLVSSSRKHVHGVGTRLIESQAAKEVVRSIMSTDRGW